jgi:predicted DNA-binding transcriptional regulator AlpA
MTAETTLRLHAPDSGTSLVPDALAAVVLLDAKALARMLSCSVRHLRRLDALGDLPAPLRLGKLVRWRADEVRDWIAAGCPDRARWQALTRASAGRREGGHRDGK